MRFEDDLGGIGSFDGMFSLQVKPDNKPYIVLLRHVSYTLEKPFQRGVRVIPTARHHNTTRHG